MSVGLHFAHHQRWQKLLCLAQPLYSGNDKRCRSRYIPADQLDTMVWHDLVEIVSEPEAILHALQRAHDGHWLPQQLQARKEALRKAQATLRQQIERLTEAYLAGIVHLPEYQRRRQELDSRDAGLEQQAKELSVHVDRQKDISDMAGSIEDFCRRIQTGLTNASFAQKRILVDRVLVINDQVEIRYVVPTHARAETTRFCHLRKDDFHDVIEVLHRPVFAMAWQITGALQTRDCWRVSWSEIGVNDTWRRSTVPDCAAEQALRRVFVAERRQKKLDGCTLRINSSVQVTPFAFDPDVSLVHTPALVRRLRVSSVSKSQFRCVALYPAPNGQMIDIDSALRQQFLDLAIRQAVTEVPTHGANDGLHAVPFLWVITVYQFSAASQILSSLVSRLVKRVLWIAGETFNADGVAYVNAG